MNPERLPNFSWELSTKGGQLSQMASTSFLAVRVGILLLAVKMALKQVPVVEGLGKAHDVTTLEVSPGSCGLQTGWPLPWQG